MFDSFKTWKKKWENDYGFNFFFWTMPTDLSKYIKNDEKIESNFIEGIRAANDFESIGAHFHSTYSNQTYGINNNNKFINTLEDLQVAFDYTIYGSNKDYIFGDGSYVILIILPINYLHMNHQLQQLSFSELRQVSCIVIEDKYKIYQIKAFLNNSIKCVEIFNYSKN